MTAPPAVRRAHRMPFGATVADDGSTLFRLWSPGARRVELWLESEQRAVAMPRDASGWAEHVAREAPAGTRYRYRIDGELLVPDPAARYQPGDVHGASEVIDPLAYAWRDGEWAGLPPERLAFYELHVGTFTPEGTFAGVQSRLDHLADLGVTAVELMPVAQFPGARGWGYDGVLLYAPESRYGRPEDLKALVDACHAHGLAVFLDVVYNHFGPEGNYLHRYAPDFFTSRHRSFWGDGINYDGPGAEIVRAFMIHNALYWLEEFHLDGLRLDAVNAIVDDSARHVLVELGRAVAHGPGRERHVHLVLENGANEARYLVRERGRAPLYRAQWNDDVHHALHVPLTGEAGGYYEDYQPPLPHLARCLTEGFAFQGERSRYRGDLRGEPSGHLPPTAFVSFLQNHDQVGNRALGDRLPVAARPLAAFMTLLAPFTPMLFQGEEHGERAPFQFFSDHIDEEIAVATREGRRREFAAFAEFSGTEVPDPQDEATFRAALVPNSEATQERARARRVAYAPLFSPRTPS